MTAPIDLVGRGEDLRELARLLVPGARVVIVGTGGVGKTAVARAVHAAGPDARWCDLSSARTADDVRSALGVTVGADAELSALGSALLVLDGLEGLEDQALGELDAVLGRAPELRVLGTSRRPAGWADEQRFPLEPLAVDDAVALFEVRARRRDPRWVPSEVERQALRALAEHLDRLPLALELAAARRAVVSPPEWLARLRDRFALLRPVPGAPQRALWDVIADTWSSLDEPTRDLLAQATIFRGGFTLAAAEDVLRSDRPLADVLQSLCDWNVLRPRTDPSTGATRFEPYESIREFASAFVVDPDALALRHVAWIERRLARLEEALARGPVGALRTETAAERWSVVAAFEHLMERDPARALALAVSASRIAALDAPLPWLARVDAALGRVRDPDPELAVRASAARAALLFDAGRPAAAAELAQAALPQAAEWPEHRCRLYRVLGIALHRLGRPREAREAVLCALDDARCAGHGAEEAAAAHVLGGTARTTPEEARRWLAASRERSAALDDAWGEAAAVASLAALETDPARKRSVNQEALALGRASGHRMVAAVAHGNLAIVALYGGDPERTVALARAGLALATPWPYTARWLLASLAGGLVDAGQLEEADEVLGRAERMRVEGTDADRASTWHERAEWHAARGELRAALAELEAVTRTGTHPAVALRRASMHAALGEPEAARAALAPVRTTVDGATWAGLLAAVDAHLRGDRAALAAALAGLRQDEDPRLGRSVRHLRSLFGGAEVEPESPRGLVVGPEATWVELDGERIDLSRRQAQRRILSTLARAHATGAASDLYDLFEAGWPGERVGHAVVASRVYNAVQRLRDAGLRDVVLQDDDGYRLDPALAVRST